MGQVEKYQLDIVGLTCALKLSASRGIEMSTFLELPMVGGGRLGWTFSLAPSQPPSVGVCPSGQKGRVPLPLVGERSMTSFGLWVKQQIGVPGLLGVSQRSTGSAMGDSIVGQWGTSSSTCGTSIPTLAMTVGLKVTPGGA